MKKTDEIEKQDSAKMPTAVKEELTAQVPIPTEPETVETVQDSLAVEPPSGETTEVENEAQKGDNDADAVQKSQPFEETGATASPTTTAAFPEVKTGMGKSADGEDVDIVA